MTVRRMMWGLFTLVAALAIIGFADAPTASAKRVIMGPRRFTFKIDPATPMTDLLPKPPLTLPTLPPYLNEDLLLVPELKFGEPLPNDLKMKPSNERDTAHIIAKINHLNREDPDGFLKALLANRTELRGLPFLMGKDCQTKPKNAQVFAETTQIVRNLLRNIAQQDPEAASIPNDKLPAEIVRREFARALADTSKVDRHRSWMEKSEIERANVAALMQMFGPQPTLFKAGLVHYLGTIQHMDATRALVKLALFAQEETVREAAIEGLKGRPTQDYATMLLKGFRYPLPAVSQRARRRSSSCNARTCSPMSLTCSISPTRAPR